jgi:hydrogenase maturation protein HypF
MACAWLVAAHDGDAAPPPAIAGTVDGRWWQRVADLCRTGLASPVTTSMGRLFDAVSAMCGIRLSVTYEGQAAAELEALCDPSETAAYRLGLVRDDDGRLVLDARETVVEAARDCAAGVPVARIAARFHNGVATATTAACIRLAGERGLDTVVLSGGSFQNRVLLERVAGDLRHAGVRVLVPERLPPNDGGISFGQAAVAAARLG